MWKYKGFVSNPHENNLEGLSYFRIPLADWGLCLDRIANWFFLLLNFAPFPSLAVLLLSSPSPGIDSESIL